MPMASTNSRSIGHSLLSAPYRGRSRTTAKPKRSRKYRCTHLEWFVGVSLSRSAVLAARFDGPVEEWPYLDSEVLLKTRSRKVCMTCHWFRHHAGVQCIPLLACQLHQGLIAQGDHLLSRCQGWTDDMARQRD